MADKEKDVELPRPGSGDPAHPPQGTQEMNEPLLVKLENTSKALAVKRAEATSPTSCFYQIVNPPTEEVDGTITEVDAQSGCDDLPSATTRESKRRQQV